MIRRVFAGLLCAGSLVLPCPGAGPPTGFRPEVRVRRPTRLGWEFVASGCGKEALKLRADFDPLGQRVRIVLDVLDQVRRDYRVDPDRTYLSGFSGGGRVACTIAFALPEYFG